MQFDWDEANISHLQRHNIEPHEAEQAVANDPIDIDVLDVDGEVRDLQVGSTNTGRILTLCSTLRGSKVRVITGWDATKVERERYIFYILGKGY